MADFLQNQPLVVLGVLVCNAVFIALLCYCCFRRWTEKRLRSNSAVIIPVTQYIIEAPAIRSSVSETAESTRNLDIALITQPYPLLMDNEQATFCVTHCQIEIPGMANAAEVPPPRYADIYPEQRKNSSVTKL